MPVLLPRFVFSQSSLQDYVDCPRRFQLRYVEASSWPALEAEPLLELESERALGDRFHRLVERHQRGVPVDKLRRMIGDEARLLAWWDAYLDLDLLHQAPGVRYPEHTLAALVGESRLAAKFDLLLVEPGKRLVIFDWKTTRRRPSQQQMAARIQTVVYPYVAVKAGTRLLGGSIAPEQVSMVYWFANDPAAPMIFDYSDQQFAKDHLALEELIRGIMQRPAEEEWPLTQQEQYCRFCEYRSLCDRGVEAGQLVDLEQDVAQSQINMESYLEGIDLGLSDVEEVGF